LFVGLQKLFRPSEKAILPQVITMENLWTQSLGFSLKPSTTAEELVALAKNLGINTAETNFDDLFHLIFLEKIEPFLKQKEAPTIVFYYPPSQAALARINAEGWADRLEVYWKGLELANAFNELNDPQEQRLRFKEDQEKKKLLGKELVP